MSLRTYPLIVHPAFLRHIESSRLQRDLFASIDAADVPVHRPDIREMSDIARYMKVSPLTIRGMIISKHKHYREWAMTQNNGKVRTIQAPRTYLKVVQWWILDTILSSIDLGPSVYGFVKHKSFKDNASYHLGASHVLNVDIEDFFPSISKHRVCDVFTQVGYPPTVARCLAELCTYEQALPQGAPTSPAIANLVLRPFDVEMEQLALSHNLKFSRYADDLTFSSHSGKIDARVLDSVRAALHQHGFRLNSRKTRWMGKNQAKEITGLILGEETVAVSRRYLNSARGWFHSILMEPQSYHEHYLRMRGTLAFLEMIGGRGSGRIIALGHDARRALEASLSGVGKTT